MISAPTCWNWNKVNQFKLVSGPQGPQGWSLKKLQSSARTSLQERSFTGNKYGEGVKLTPLDDTLEWQAHKAALKVR